MSGIDIDFPYISSGESVKLISFPYDFDILSLPSVPSNKGIVMIT